MAGRIPLIHIAIVMAFVFNSLGPLPTVSANEFRLPVPGIRVYLSPQFNPPILKGLKVYTDNPFRFDFILDQGDDYGSLAKEEDLKEESVRLIKYFLVTLTIPEKDLWVNLSPYEKDRIIPKSFGLTEMGRDLLAQDYMLKQITASLMYPEDELGKKFWKSIYEKALKRLGTTDIPVNTFNKVWIVPEKAVVYENAKAKTAYVVESKLKVMLEQDYLSLQEHSPTGGHLPEGQVSPSSLPTKEVLQRKASQTNNPITSENINVLGSQVIREIIIPELNKEVNENKNFAQLRQVYNSLVLATWYKKKIKDSILAQVYADKKKVAGVRYDPSGGDQTEMIYQRYLQAFKKGVYNYIKETIDPLTQETVPRKYFSGGANFARTSMILDEALLTTKRIDFAQTGHLKKVKVDFAMAGGNLSLGDGFSYVAQAAIPTKEDRLRRVKDFLNSALKRTEGAVKRLEDIHPYGGYIIDLDQPIAVGIQGKTISMDHFEIYFSTILKYYIKLGQASDYISLGDSVEINDLLNILTGNELERVSMGEINQTIPLDYWGPEWKKARSTGVMTDGEVYERLVHPIMSDVVKRVLEQMSIPEAPRILDLLGGDGMFLRLLAGHLAGMPIGQPSLSLIDGNQASVERSKQNLQGIVPDENIHLLDVRDNLRVASLLNQIRPFVVTSNGGLTEGVLDKNQGIALAQHVFTALPDGGFFIVTGFTKTLLNAAEFRSIGFEVLNKSVHADFQGLNVAQFYILRKPSAKVNESMASKSAEKDLMKDVVSSLQGAFPGLKHNSYYQANGEYKLDYIEAQWNGQSRVILRRHGNTLYYDKNAVDEKIIDSLRKQYPQLSFISLLNAGFISEYNRQETPEAARHASMAAIEYMTDNYPDMVRESGIVDFGAGDGQLGIALKGAANYLFVEPDNISWGTQYVLRNIFEDPGFDGHGQRIIDLFIKAGIFKEIPVEQLMFNKDKKTEEEMEAKIETTLSQAQLMKYFSQIWNIIRQNYYKKKVSIQTNAQNNGLADNKFRVISFLGKSIDEGKIDPEDPKWKNAIVIMNIGYDYGDPFVDEVLRLKPAVIITTGWADFKTDSIMNKLDPLRWTVKKSIFVPEIKTPSSKYLGLVIVRNDVEEKQAKILKIQTGAHLQPTQNGGIDLTSAQMNLQTQSNGGAIKFKMDPDTFRQFLNAPGLVPVIVNIQPLTDLKMFLGAAVDQSSVS
ncbi:MAG: hypothetical protein HQL14_05290 [Candidatus Omnitrophica bacterium]|nr:hypothetical protein [Candidatus Omnitrophota bacterium]